VERKRGNEMIESSAVKSKCEVFKRFLEEGTKRIWNTTPEENMKFGSYLGDSISEPFEHQHE